MFYTYIIKSKKNGSFYVGITSNINRRLDEHNKGKLKYTSKIKPWILWYVRKLETMKEARIEEIYLKKKNRQFKENIKNIMPW